MINSPAKVVSSYYKKLLKEYEISPERLKKYLSPEDKAILNLEIQLECLNKAITIYSNKIVRERK